jgi:hypothetical protein
MIALMKLKAKRQHKVTQQKQELNEQNKTKKGLSAVGAVFSIIGVLGLAVFGYLIFENGGLGTLPTVADALGIITSVVVLVAGVYAK